MCLTRVSRIALAARSGAKQCFAKPRARRPQALYRPIYILRFHYLISLNTRQWSGLCLASNLDLTFYQVTRQNAVLVNDSRASCET